MQTTPASPTPPPELARIDVAILATFLTTPYAGPAEVVLAQYQRDAEEAHDRANELQRFAITCPSREWTAAAVAQQGRLFDSLATKLDDLSLPASSLVKPPMSAALNQLTSSGRATLMQQADELRRTIAQKWRSRQDVEVAAALELAIRPYATAVDLARKYGLRSADVDLARERLAHYTVTLGDAKMRAYVTKAKIDYRDGMYVDSSVAP